MKTFIPTFQPLNWKFKDPDSGREFEERTKKNLFQKIVAYRSQNTYDPIEELSLVLDNYNCELPEHCGVCEDTFLVRGVLQYIKGGISLITQALFKSFVTQEVADERAELCIQCPNNQFPDKDAFVQWTDAVAEESVGDRRAAHHEQLGNCIACTCVLKAKVFFGGKIQLSDKERKDIHQVQPLCWQLKI